MDTIIQTKKESIIPTPYTNTRMVVKTEVTVETKLKLQQMAVKNKRSMRKQLEHIIEEAVNGKEDN